MRPIDFFQKHEVFKRLVGEYSGDIQAAPTGSMCSCCKTEVSEGVSSEEYATQVWHCPSCHILFHGSFDLLGQEGVRGKNATPVPFKIGMMAGCAMYIDDNHVILYAPGKHYPKLNNSKSIFSDIRDIGGNAAVIDMANEYRTRAPEKAILIRNLGKKKAGLVSSLGFSNGNLLHLSDDNGAFQMKISDLDFALSLASLDKKASKMLNELIAKSCRSALPIEDAKKMNEMLAADASLLASYRKLSDDPHVRLTILKFAS